MNTVITPTEKKAVIAVTIICFVVMILVKLRLDTVLAR